ncbi:MAG: FMN-binding negative transcriptional regulator [Steroidobacteraceae bacterium]
MYVPEHFRETRIEVLRAFVERHSFGTLVAVTPEGITANHIPMQLLSGSDGPGLLRGHIARANPLWRLLEPGASVLAVFIGPDHYVSPSWYPSKHEHGEAVPTWNYATVHVKGHIRFIDDPGWLRTLVESLTDEHERQSVNRWRITDAPADYIAGMLRAIVGFEIQVSAIEGKFKGSQNRSAADRAGVAEALRAAGLPLDEVAQLAPESGS